MKYCFAIICLLASACTFSPSQFRCDESAETRSGFECKNKVWVELDAGAVEDQQFQDTEDLSPDIPKTFCGDGLIQSGEACDSQAFKDSCESLGFAGGDLICTGCAIDTSDCTPKPDCGNGKIDQGEDCEMGLNLDNACEKMGFIGGELRCSNACLFDTSRCTSCGNESIENEEICDGKAFGNSTCSTVLGYEAVGELSCESCQKIGADACEPVFIQVAAGHDHTCGLKSDGGVQCWGKNNRNQTDVPQNQKFTSIKAGKDFSCGILESQKVLCWGSNDDGRRTPPGETFLKIALGDKHGCGITTANKISCWGSNGLRTAGLDGTFDSVDVWQEHGCALNGEELSCWGRSNSGERMIPDGKYKRVSVGKEFTCSVRLDNELDCWGRSDDGETSPPAGQFIEVDSSSFHSCAIEMGTNVAKCWGFNGDEKRIEPPTPLQPYRQISTGRRHACAVTLDGNIQCWGSNAEGESTPPIRP